MCASSSARRWSAGHWVICDRFADSTRVYQGALGNVDPRVIRSLERVAVGDTQPDLTFILDVPGGGRARPRGEPARPHGRRPLRGRDDRIPHASCARPFSSIAAREPDRCVVIDAQADAANVADAIWAVVSRRLDPASAPVIIEAARP